ncbi:hypothetical protein CDL12_08347 [Handroanthus impetiginosus]|uniref:Uncharacterized protein n=1 Tax=Handroanthus impetiginosus TaxID=429701 RepID=A0A2G9HN73_9LAMI|nr:hypothetical protein CDL12_08347 [Handroanthus impetiginosus]
MPKNPLSVILKANKLTGPNYGDWLQNLKIVLDFEKMTYVLTKSLSDIIPDYATLDMQKTVNRRLEDDLQTRYLMLASMSRELQKSHEHMKHSSEIHMHLEELNSVQMRYERYNTSKELFRARIIEGSSLRKLDVVMDNDLYIDLILQSLPGLFDKFVINFNMSKLDMTINELVNMLITAKSTMKKDKTMLIASTSKAHMGKMGKKKKKKKSQH